jgi:hypothetical protein
MSLAADRAAFVGSEQSLYYLDTAQTATVANGKVTGGTFNEMFLMADNDSVDTGGSVESYDDVTQKLAPSYVKYDQQTMDYEAPYLKGNAVSDKLEELYRNKYTGTKATFTIVEVDNWGDTDAKVYVATVVIVITGITNEAQDNRKIECSIGFVTDWQEVTNKATVDADEGTVAFTE